MHIHEKEWEQEAEAPEAAGRVLIVEDHEPSAALARDMLCIEYHTACAASGPEALVQARRFCPDVVLLDVGLPQMSGYEVCRRLRAESGDGNLKIILLSARSELADRLEGYEAGADDFLVKPYETEELRAKVRVFQRLKATEDSLQSLNEELEERVLLRTRQLREAELMSTLGRHAAGIVHNLNNPLAGILGYAELLHRAHPDSKHTGPLLQMVEEMRRIIASLLGAVREQGAEEAEAVDINAVLTRQLELLKMNSFFKTQVACTVDPAPLPKISGVGHHFSQVFGNILKNALDAMVDAPERRLDVRTRFDGQTVEVEIADTGCGMSAGEAEKIFDPLFTTKPAMAEEEGRPVGTGLGLSTVKEIVDSYGGEIEVTSAPEHGTAFFVRIPARIETINTEARQASRFGSVAS